MDINCEDDRTDHGAPLPFSTAWSFKLQKGSPALTGGVTDFSPLFTNGLAFFGMKKVMFAQPADDQSYYFVAPLPTTRFGAILQ